MTPWKRYVDNTIAVISMYCHLASIEYVLSVLISFHQNVEIIYELEQNGKINFLDILL